ncbi:dnaJ homolog subfamily C member 11-like [Agrilus planipennis]|uniref:DnaJ homolog subfamily C member 11-like n=1 Tax=Agrilus planipennis TaxID=224129 RepID=A0A7F5QX30_AGRPL|nr:dnaJ homolog subfamily C member 11-like [Agrilus planipennis]
MDFDSDDESALLQDDYYAFLNISKEATKEEINNAYRRLSRIYHPDKHLDPEKKQKAEILFNKTKKAYEVLSDPHQRAIYDNLGVKGLETEGWEIVQRTKTPAEIRAEYEQLAEERAERRKQQRTNPHGSITVNINATDLFNPYINEYGVQDEYEIEENSVLPNIEVSGMSFNQSVEFPLTQKDTATLSGQLQLTRANQVYSFPIHLCEEVMPAPVFYGTIVPLIVYAVIKKSLVEPFLKEQEAKRAETEKQNNRTKLLEKRKEAQAAVELMSATYARIVRDEDAKKGLVIEKALYGKALRSNNRDSGDFAEEILDVTIPLQCLVKDSKLELHNHTKSQLPGFFDPALGENKYLYVKYKFRDQFHEITINDNEPLRIPKTAHRTSVT